MDLLDWVPLVRLVVRRLAATLPAYMQAELCDLLQIGFIGLMEAAEKWDPTRGTQFRHFAEWRIRGAVQDYLRLQDREGRTQRLRHRWASAHRRQMEQQAGRSVGWCEVAEALGVTLEQISVRPPISSLDVTLFVDGNEDMGEQIGMGEVLGRPGGQEEGLAAEGLAKVLAGEISRLRENEQLVLQLYHWEGLNMREIGEIMELTESRICQIYNKAIRKLQAPGPAGRLQETLRT